MPYRKDGLGRLASISWVCLHCYLLSRLIKQKRFSPSSGTDGSSTKYCSTILHFYLHSNSNCFVQIVFKIIPLDSTWKKYLQGKKKNEMWMIGEGGWIRNAQLHAPRTPKSWLDSLTHHHKDPWCWEHHVTLLEVDGLWEDWSNVVFKWKS